MTMAEIVQEVSFSVGLTSTDNVENVDVKQAVLIAFRELKRYIRTPVEKTVPFSTRIDLQKVGINTKKVLYAFAATPRIGLTMSSIDSGNVFQVAAAVNTYSAIGQTSTINIDPIMTEMAMAQVRNTLSTDFQWRHDTLNNCLYCTHRDPRPSHITVQYVPDFQDVSEIESDLWVDYLIRLSQAHLKLAIGRIRSKYTIEGSNVSLDGDQLLSEANDELAKIREEIEAKRRKLVVLN